MKIYDVVWERQNITDKDITQIIKHPSFQRLKNIWISTYGYLFELKRNSTRYEHSLGVYLLLKHFNATKEEQVAGLIHDISHTALSHVSTYAFQGRYTGTEFHELQHNKFVKTSGLSELLVKLGYDVETLLHNKSHTLLDNELPDICADRIDYALRDGLHLQILSRQQVQQVLDGLKIYKNEFVFTNVDAAFTYSLNFYLLNLMFYGSPTEAHFNNDFGNLVKYAVKNNILKESDWFTDDVYLTNKLKRSKDSKIIKWLEKYNNNLVVYEDTETPDIVFPKKLRVVDPKILKGNKLYKLSKLSPIYNKLITDYQKSHKNHELPVKMIYKNKQ